MRTNEDGHYPRLSLADAAVLAEQLVAPLGRQWRYVQSVGVI